METFFQQFHNLVEIKIFLVFILGLYLSNSIFPVVIYLTVKKKLMNEPCSRSSHTRKTPNLGGVGIFISFLICTCISASVFNFLEIELKQLLSVIGSISILFFLGIKDDLIGITPLQKLIGQFFAALIVVFIADIRIDSWKPVLF